MEIGSRKILFPSPKILRGAPDMFCDTQKSSPAASVFLDGDLEMELRAEKMVRVCQGAGKN